MQWPPTSPGGTPGVPLSVMASITIGIDREHVEYDGHLVNKGDVHILPAVLCHLAASPP